MTNTTIFGTVTAAITLDSGEYGGILTICSSAFVHPTAAGVSAITGLVSNETVINFGTVAAASGLSTYSPGGDGVSLYCEASVDNDGFIEGGTSGFSNQGLEQGGAGIDFHSFGNVSNAGTITGGAGGGGTNLAANGGFALDLQGGGRVVNSGSIVGGRAGIDALGGGEGGIALMLTKNAEVVNTGLIQAGAGAPITHLGERTNSGPAIQFQSTGELVNAGTIGEQTVGSVGVLSAGYIDLDNFGKIFGLEMLGGGHLTNAGTVDGEDGSTSFQGLPNPGSIAIAVKSPAKIVNVGSISGGNGYSGGSLGGATGGAGILLAGPQEFLINNGSISGGTGSGVDGGAGGIGVLLGGSDVVINQGQITGGEGANGDGVELNLGLFTNMGTISGGGGVSAASPLSAGAFVNGGILIAQAGIIEGGSYSGQAGSHGFAVDFGNTASGTLVVNPNAAFIGGIQASNVIQDTLVLSGTSNGTMNGFGEQYGVNNFSKILETNGAHWNLTGTISASSMTFEGGSWLGLTGTTSQTNVYFANAGGDQLDLNIPESFHGVLHGFNATDSIFLNGLDGQGFHFSQGKLIIFGSGGDTLTSLSFQGNYLSSDFALKNLGGQTEISWSGAGSSTPFLHS